MISTDKITTIFYSIDDFCLVLEPALKKKNFQQEKGLETGNLKYHSELIGAKVFTTCVNHFNAPPIITKITARTTDFPLSNSMAESAHSIYKTEFLKGQISRTVKNHLDNLKRFVAYYNHERHSSDLYGLTTMEVINGKIPDKDYFKNQIAEAKLTRVTIKKSFNKCAFVG